MSTLKVWYSQNTLPNNWMNSVSIEEEGAIPQYIGPTNASDTWTNNWLEILNTSTFPYQSLTNTANESPIGGGIDYSKTDNFFWTKVAKIHTNTPYNLPGGYTGFFETVFSQNSYTSNDGSVYTGLVNVNISSSQDTQYIWPILPPLYTMSISNKEIVYNWGYIYSFIKSNNKLPLTLDNKLIKIPFGISGPNYSNLFPGITGNFDFDPQLTDGTYLVGQTGPLQVIKPVKFEDAKDLNSYVLKNGSAYQEAKSFFTYIPVNTEDDSNGTNFDYNKFTFNQLVPKNYVDQLYNNIVGEGSVNAVTTLKQFQDILAGNTGIFTDVQSLSKGAIRSDANYYSVQKIDSGLEIGNSLKVNGSSFMVGDVLKTTGDKLSVMKNIEINGTMNTNGIATFNSNVGINGKLDVTGYTTFNSNVGITGELDVSGYAVFNSSIDVYNAAILGVTGQTGQQGLVVHGTSLFLGDITYFGKLSLGGNDNSTSKTSLSGNSITTESIDVSRVTIGSQNRKSSTSVLTIDQLDETTTDLLDIKSTGTASVKIDKHGAIKMTSNVSKVQLANKEVDSGVFYINDKWCIVTDDTKSLSFFFRKNPNDDWKCGVKFKTS